MNESKVNFVIDALMFLCMAAILGMGLLMKFSLIPGKEILPKYGRNVGLSLFGMDRHEWGTIHLAVGIVLIALLAVHIVLHWKMILTLYRRLIASRSARRVVATAFLIVCAILIAFPFLLEIEVQEIKGAREHRAAPPAAEETKAPAEDAEESLNIKGYMTLNEVAETYSVPIEHLKTKLGLPQETPGDEKLGALRRSFGFKMTDVGRIIDEYRQSRQ